jgi:L-threonylcarbamoyladenylate synthase
MPQILKVDPSSWENTLSETRKVLKAGGIVAFPTDTFYGLGVNPYNRIAVDKIYEIKGRDPKKPLLLLIDSVTKLENLVEEPSAACIKLMQTFWPGPLTLLFKPKPSSIHENITADLIGIRQPGNPVTRKILSELDHPLTAPSANISGGAPATTAQQVQDTFGEKVELILDAGECQGGKPSTLINATDAPARLIRAGEVDFEDIQECLKGFLQTQESL